MKYLALILLAGTLSACKTDEAAYCLGTNTMKPKAETSKYIIGNDPEFASDVGVNNRYRKNHCE